MTHLDRHMLHHALQGQRHGLNTAAGAANGGGGLALSAVPVRDSRPAGVTPQSFARHQALGGNAGLQHQHQHHRQQQQQQQQQEAQLQQRRHPQSQPQQSAAAGSGRGRGHDGGRQGAAPSQKQGPGVTRQQAAQGTAAAKPKPGGKVSSPALSNRLASAKLC